MGNGEESASLIQAEQNKTTPNSGAPLVYQGRLRSYEYYFLPPPSHSSPNAFPLPAAHFSGVTLSKILFLIKTVTNVPSIMISLTQYKGQNQQD